LLSTTNCSMFCARVRGGFFWGAKNDLSRQVLRRLTRPRAVFDVLDARNVRPRHFDA
jgi:hypothetical protein